MRAWANIDGVGWRETGQAGSSYLVIAYGGDVLVGGKLHVVGGNGGNNSMDATESSSAGDGGTEKACPTGLALALSTGASLTHLSLLLLLLLACCLQAKRR